MLARAAAQVGGVAELAARLNLSSRALREYVTGRLAVPDALFLRVPALRVANGSESQARANRYREEYLSQVHNASVRSRKRFVAETTERARAMR